MGWLQARNEIRWQPGESVLPMRAVHRGSIPGGILVSLFGLGWCGVLGACIVVGTLEEGANLPMTVLLLLFSLPGLLFLLIGLSLLFGRREVFVSRDVVQVRERPLLHTRAWREPLDRYRGVLKRFVHHSGGRNASSWTEYLVVLAHEDASREVQLFRARGRPGIATLWSRSWDRFAELFGMPLLEEGEDGVRATRRAQAHLPLRERLRGGAVAPPVETSAELSPRIDVSQRGDASVFRYRRFWDCWRGALGIAVASAMLLAVRHIEAGQPGESGIELFSWAIWGFLGLFALSLLRDAIGSEELRIDASRVATRSLPDPRGRSLRWLATAQVRDVRVKRDPRHPTRPAALVIEGSDRSLRFGATLPRGLKLRLADRVLALLAEGVEPGELDPEAGPVSVGDPVREGRRRLRFVPVFALAFFAALAGAMHFAFRDAPPSRDPEAAAPIARGRAARPAASATRSWIQHYNAAERAVAAKDYAAAEREFRLAIGHAERPDRHDDAQLAATVDYLGWVLIQRGRVDEGEALRQRARSLRRGHGRE